jgi:hypothetical protein
MREEVFENIIQQELIPECKDLLCQIRVSAAFECAENVHHDINTSEWKTFVPSYKSLRRDVWNWENMRYSFIQDFIITELQRLSGVPLSDDEKVAIQHYTDKRLYDSSLIQKLETGKLRFASRESLMKFVTSQWHFYSYAWRWLVFGMTVEDGEFLHKHLCHYLQIMYNTNTTIIIHNMLPTRIEVKIDDNLITALKWITYKPYPYHETAQILYINGPRREVNFKELQGGQEQEYTSFKLNEAWIET